MKLIFAQGNPGHRFHHTRHNVGFFMINAVCDAHRATWKASTKYPAVLAEVSVGSQKALLVKPTTFYNETGLLARQLVDFYKLDPSHDLLVIHDDLSLPFGTIRIREKGSDAGNNGIKSLTSHLGEHYQRLRVGIWSPQRDLMDDASFVLSQFDKAEHEALEGEIAPKAIELIESFIDGALEKTSHTLFSSPTK